MTAPLAPVPFVAGSPADVVGTMEKTIAATLAQAPTEPIGAEVPANVPVAHPRDEAGKFVPKAGSEEAITHASTPAAEPIDETPAAPVIPDGHVAVPAVPEDKARGWTVRDAEGEIVPPDLTWELTANGKPRTLSTDKLVSYAQMGVYNAEREQAHQQLQQTHRQTEEKYSNAEQLLQMADQHVGKLLSDPDYLIRHIQEYEARNTPEARQRAEQTRMEQERQQLETQKMGWQANQFVDSELTPACDKILSALPHITSDELGSRLLLEIDRYRVNGVLDPRQFQAVRDTVTNSLVPWARQVNEYRESEKGSTAKADADAKAKAAKDVADAQAKAQRAKRQMTLKPGGQGAPPHPTNTKPTTRKGVEEAVIGNSLAAMRGSG